MTIELFQENIEDDLTEYNPDGLIEELMPIHRLDPQNLFIMSFLCITKLLGLDKDKQNIITALPTDTSNFDLQNVLSSMANLHYLPLEIETDLQSLDNRIFPCLFVPSAYNRKPRVMIIIKQNGENEFLVYFPDSKEVEKLSTQQLQHYGEGKLYRFRPMSENTQAVTYNEDAPFSQACLKRFSGAISIITLLVLIYYLIVIAAAIATKVLLENVIFDQPDLFVYWIMPGFLSIVAMYLIYKASSQYMAWFSARMHNFISQSLFLHYLSNSPNNLRKRSTAEQLVRSQVHKPISDYTSSPLFASLFDAMMIPFLMLAMLMISSHFTYLPLFLLLIYGAILIGFVYYILPILETSAKSSSRRNEIIMESLEKILFLRINGISDNWVTLFREASGNASLDTFRISWALSIVSICSQEFKTIALILINAYGIIGYWHEATTLGEIIAVNFLSWHIIYIMQNFLRSLTRLIRALKAFNKIDQIMQQPVELSYSTDSQLNNIKGSISFINVNSSQQSSHEPNAISGLNFSLGRGEVMAISGGTHSNRSTILKMINAMERPAAGSVRIDGIDIRQAPPTTIRKQITYISHSSNLFYGTIADNIRFYRPDASNAMIELMLNRVGAWNFVKKLQYGINTPLYGEDIPFVSSSLKNQIIMSRLIISDTPIVLIDKLPKAVSQEEKTSDLLAEFIQANRGEKTIIFVTSSSEDIQLADKVLISEKGSHFILRKNR
jgi:ATP-binding cassette subfamily C protein LapB